MPILAHWVGDKPPTLEQAQEVVGGYVQMLTLADGSQMLVDEDGLMKVLDVNEEASRLAGPFGPIVGNALILKGDLRWLPERE